MKRSISMLVLTLSILLFNGSVFAKDVGLLWDAPADNDLAYYNVYRSGTSGNFSSPIGTVDASITGYTDIITADGTYYWIVTAVDTAGNESIGSNELSMTIDTLAPSPPTNLRFE